MINLMIVDDDEYIRNGLKSLIPWDEIGIEIIGEAENGLEAMRFMKINRPHLLLTDIRMANGDGLELIRSVRSMGWSTRIIVLSGYNDFGYVREAMKYQIEDYLLKPVNEDELEEIFKTCVNQMKTEWLHDQTQKEALQLFRNNILIRWVENRIDADQLKQKCEFVGLHISSYHSYQIGLVVWRDTSEAALTSIEEKFRPFAILNVLEELMSRDDKGVAFLDNKQRIVCVFLHKTESMSHESFEQANLIWLTNAAEQVSDLLRIPWFSTLGKSVPKMYMVHHSYKNALQLLDYADLTGDFLCIDSHWVKESFHLLKGLPSIQAPEKWIQSLLSGHSEEWISGVEADFQWALVQANSITALRTLTTVWMVKVRQALKKMKLFTSIEGIESSLIINISQMESEDEIRKRLKDYFIQIQTLIKNAAITPRNSIVSQVEQIVKKDLNNPDLSLKTIAQQLHVNSAYLGRVFKEETGEYFSDCLNQTRLEKAKNLLMDTKLKASEISEHVGFSDSNYFFRKFKQFVGLSPIEYRKLHSRQV